MSLTHVVTFALSDASWQGPVMTFLDRSWQFFTGMAPYLLFGFLAAGVLAAFISPSLIERHLGGHGFWPVFKAALIGVPLPLCSCSVLPVTASLRKHGAGRGAATAFLISTPETGVDSILVTFSLLGPVFAIFRPLAALVSGLIGGMVVDVLEPHGEADVQEIEKCLDACCSPAHAAYGRTRVFRILHHAFVELPRDIGRPLLIGLVVAGAIGAFAPQDVLEKLGSGFGGIVLMMLLGIPIYVCATASVPIAAALILKGVSPGAALAFLMTGPATNAAGIATVWKIMGPRTTIVYLGAIALTALGAGLALDALVGHLDVQMVHVHEMQPGWFSTAAAVALILVLGYALIPRRHASHDHGHDHDHSHGHNHEHGHDHGPGEGGEEHEHHGCCAAAEGSGHKHSHDHDACCCDDEDGEDPSS